ncbi:hypothetical protein KUTeg_023909 [Tegillarca granosa]|uniref:Uncharacterized protein n=1 Tax=Tegillarca granosa TaxID=220873 RepID=A0ABQ9DVT3_TEGGR|nr:hypothetical protein KUTeg_023909 [Tegillarca granosa]
MMKYAVCMFVCLLTLSEADKVIEHVLLADIKTNGIPFSYTNKNECAGADERWLSELVGVTKSSRGPATELEKQLKEYDDNDVIKKAETELDNPRSEAAKNYSTLVLASAAPVLTASSKIPWFVFKKVDTCPERKYVLRYYWEIYHKRICRVVRPFQQYQTYVTCPQKPTAISSGKL